MAFSVELEGMEQALATYLKIKSQMPAALSHSLYRQAELTMTLAKRLTPVETGRLRASGRVSPPSVFGGRIIINMGFYTEYAIYVHENLNARHPVGQAKFLESAVNQRLRQIEAQLTADMKRALSKI